MIEFLLILRLLIGLVFVSSATSKLTKMKIHKQIVKEYNIIPTHLLNCFITLEVTIELLLGLMILFGFYDHVALIGAILLMISYVYAISSNIIKGNYNISCGCGGIVGETKLSWNLVLRNTGLIGIMFSLFFYSSPLLNLDNIKQFLIDITSYNVIISILISIFIAVAISVIFRINTIKTLFNNLFLSIKKIY
ncbi:putative membrane protein YphA (DoxX/SURF4 family) [Rossellomorea marisflavi]